MAKLNKVSLEAAMRQRPAAVPVAEDKRHRLDLAEAVERQAELQAAGAPLRVVPNKLVPGTDATPHELEVYEPGMTLIPGRQYKVPLEFLKENPNNSRAIYLDDSVQAMVESLREHGQLQAALAYAPSASEPIFVLKEGHTRARALRRLPGKQYLRVEVVERVEDPMLDYQQSRDINLKRKELTVFDDAVRFRELMDALELTQEAIADALKLRPDYVSKVLKIGRMPQLLLERMAACTDPAFGTAMAYAVAQVYERKGADAADRFVSRIIDTKPSVRQVEVQLRAMWSDNESGDAQAAAPRMRRLRPLSRAEVTGAAKGEVKLFPDGRIELELTDIDEAVRQQLYASMLTACTDAGLNVSGVMPDARS